ncbi:phage minor capsid protein [Streptomyces nodosus]|uniref:phage minor capsid protein n=1 Tax=Streptomyces nodosus TaxID=40318 RepID=UPI00381F6F38
MAIHPGMVEPLAERTRDLYADAEERLFGIIARQLAAGHDAPQWAERKLAAIQQVRRASQAVVDELGKAVSLDVHDAVAEAYNVGHRAAVAELGALPDSAVRHVDDVLPQAQAVDRLAAETVDRLTATHRSILRAVDDQYRAVIAEVSATPLLGAGTRRQATQDAMARFADRGITGFRDRAGRRWQLTSYAEMAVRTSVGRAATEAHMQTLTAHGMDLVMVSVAPRVCPLCRPWEGKVLSIGRTGAGTVQAQHATDDARTVAVQVAGTLDEARGAGLQHPNCRHSVSAYLPGITAPAHGDNDADNAAGYAAGQRQRAIERNIRKWKRQEAAATTPEAQKAARAKIRQHQAAMRDHLAAHPDLRRLRAREQLGASNVPSRRPPAPDTAHQAARVRSGDHLTPREMSDAQLSAAMRHADLTPQDRARIMAEADRRDTAALLDRARPRGRLTNDLLTLSDDELARVLPHLDDHDTMRVMAEVSRRARAGQLPSVRRDLTGLSDAQLAARYRHAPGDRAAIAEEAERRDMLARHFPGGHLAEDLTVIGDDALAWCMQYANDREILRIAAEMDRRDAVTLPRPSSTGNAVDDLLADRNALAETMRPAPDPEGWGTLADDDAFWKSVKDAAAKRHGTDEPHDERHTVTRAEARAMYDEYVYRQMLAAVDACNGYLFNKKAAGKGYSELSLFSGPARIAYARASDDLKAWWAEHGRMTQAEFIESVTGKSQRWAAGARKNESDHQNKR